MNQLLLQHFNALQNVGVLDSSQANVCQASVGSADHGRRLILSLLISNDAVIQAAKFKAQACPYTLGLASYMTQWLIGKSTQQALALKSKDIASMVDLPSSRIACAVLFEDAIKTALKDFKVAK